MLLVASGNNWVLLGDQSIVAMPENQGLPGRVMVEIRDLADKNDMVTALIGIGHLAFEDGERIGKNRTAIVPGLIVDAHPFVVERARKAARYVLLAFTQDIHREMIGRQIGFEAVGLPAETPQHQ